MPKIEPRKAADRLPQAQSQSLPTKPEAEPEGFDPKQHLTPKQMLFTRYYIIKLSAVDAALRAGLGSTYQSAAVIGHRLLKNVNVQKYASLLQQQAMAEVGLTHNQVLRQRKDIAFFDDTEMFEDDGQGGMRLKSLRDLRKLGGMVKIRATRDRNGQRLDVESQDKDKSLAALEQYFRDKTSSKKAKVVINNNINIEPEDDGDDSEADSVPLSGLGAVEADYTDIT